MIIVIKSKGQKEIICRNKISSMCHTSKIATNEMKTYQTVISQASRKAKQSKDK